MHLFPNFKVKKSVSYNKISVAEALLTLHRVGHACYEDRAENKDDFSQPSLRLVAEDRAVLQGRSRALPLSLLVKGSRRDKPVDWGLVIAIPMYSPCASPKNTTAFLTVQNRAGVRYRIHLVASCFLITE